MRMAKVIICLFLALFCVASPALAQTAIAVVDLQKIMTDAKVAQSVQTQVQTYRDKFQAEVTKMEEDLREAQKTLSAPDNGLTAEQLNTQKQDFERNLANTRNVVEKKKRALDEGFNAAMEKLRADIIKVVAAISDEKGYQLVLTRENVVLVEKSIDITEDVMARLDSQAQEIKVEVKEE